MPRRVTLTGALLALALAAPAPAYALRADETSTLGAVSATLSYDYAQSSYGPSGFKNLHVTIDRGGQRLVDKALGTDSPWPAAAGTKGQKSIRVVDLDADGEPEVLVELFTGGANCCFYTESWRWDDANAAYVEQTLRPSLSFPYVLKDLNNDGVLEFRSVDYRFAYEYGSNADTPRPLQIFDWNGGNLVDVTIGYPKLAARDASSLYRVYLRIRKQKDANLRGVLAAYLADSYRAGKGKAAWRNVVAAYHHGELGKKSPADAGAFGKRYLISVRKFLNKLGYLRGP
jgi:hypothetical protein